MSKLLSSAFYASDRIHCLSGLLMAPWLLFAASVGAGTGLAEYEQPWELCALCHALDGNSHMARFPILAGQRKEYIEKQLGDFLSGHRDNDCGQMSSIVTEVDPDEFSSIAQWFSSQEPPAPHQVDISEMDMGQALFDKSGCSDCHKDENQGSSSVPLLTSQHPEYLLKQMNDFQKNRRHHVSDITTTEILKGLSDSEQTYISVYLAGTPRR